MKNINLKRIIILVFGIVLAISAGYLLFTSAESDNERRCIGIKVNIKDRSEQLLVTDTDVINWVTRRGSEPVDGKVISTINLSNVEKRVMKSGMIQACEAYIDLKGYLHVDVKVFTPMVRILGEGTLPDRYMDAEGNFFPVSKNFTPTVMLVSGDYFKKRKSLKSSNNKDLLDFIKTLTEDEFWNAQISQIEVDKNKEIQLVPLLGQNIIEFGKPEKVSTKLQKLMVFYKKILPMPQWNNFNKVSVKYNGQIVCS